ncbi:MAG: TlpA family protein disulfide reductase [Syntrophorhabdaceae bacterium]|nr:TlpA family protein disulfide reductase [Syntrophorhabdaceae bacterium]
MRTSSRECDPADAWRRCPCALVLPALLALLLSAGNAFSQDNPAPVSPGSGTVERRRIEPGMGAPGFALKDIAGASFTFAAEKTKSPMLFVFFSIFCESCRRSLAHAQRLQDRFGRTGLRVVAVALDGQPFRSSVSGFARQEGYGFRVLMDEIEANDRFRAADLFGVTEIPTSVLIGSGGRILFVGKGVVPEGDIEKFLTPAKKP